jgi:hypothetical protein
MHHFVHGGICIVGEAGRIVLGIETNLVGIIVLLERV